MKLATILLEEEQHPKAVVMGGGAGVGKSYLVGKLDLGGLPIFNPDKYVEDPKSKYHNNLTAAAKQTLNDVENATQRRESFLWDTTARTSQRIQELINKQYGVFMVLVYTHPMISFISNALRPERTIPKSAVFLTWRDIYTQIPQYRKMLGENFAIFNNDRGGEFKEAVRGFDKAAQRGPEAIQQYLDEYIKTTGSKQFASTFRKPLTLSQEEEKAFKAATRDLDYNREDYSIDRAVKAKFLKSYQGDGSIPSLDSFKKTIQSKRKALLKRKETDVQVLQDVVQMLNSKQFQESVKGIPFRDISQKLQNFLG